MNPRSKLLGSLLLASAFATVSALAGPGNVCFNAFQQGVAKGPIAASRDPEMEKQAYHSLEVAKYYFYKRKPDENDKDGWARLNKSVEGRLTEIMDTHPTFARMDDVYFILGEVYKRMGDLDKATEHWNKAAKETSDEKIKSEVQKRLNESKKEKK